MLSNAIFPLFLNNIKSFTLKILGFLFKSAIAIVESLFVRNRYVLVSVFAPSVEMYFHFFLITNHNIRTQGL
jgi:hypothetical protein